MRFRTRITTASILLAVIPLLIASITIGELSYESGRDGLREEVERNLISRRNLKLQEVESYLLTIEKQAITQASSTMFINAASIFISAFDNYLTETEQNPLTKQKLDAYYEDKFHTTYKQKNSGHQLNISQLKQSISSTGIALQSAYIGDNPNPLGSKDALDSYNDNSSYSAAHQSFHPSIRTFLNAFGYYDIFIVDPKNGNVVYSVFKEMDYATSLETGPYKNSGLAQAYNNAKSLSHGQAKFTQFSPYTPSYESPAAFISTPIMEDGQLSAILIFQMPVGDLNKMMTFDGNWSENGMGESAEIYLVDKNKKILNNSRFFVENNKAFLELIKASGFDQTVVENIVNKQSNIGILPVNSLGVDAALQGQSGFSIFNDYRDVPVVSAYAPVKVGNLGWAILSEVDAEEAFRSTTELGENIIRNVIAFLLVALALSIAIGWRIASSATRPIEVVSNTVQKIAKNNDFTLEVPNEDDEIKSLSSAINRLIKNLNLSIGSVKNTVDILKDSSKHVADMTDDMRNNIAKQESECSQVASAASELQSTANEVATNAASTANQTSNANQTTQQTQSIVKDSNAASIKLADELSQSKDILNKVAQESEQISAVLDVINGIAEQTNLLALNAAIEAARAGEQGRGFAVVADEVRQLAQRTQSATTEIEQMIIHLQSSSTEAVGAIDRGNSMAAESVTHSSKISESLNQVADLVSNIADMNTQVATASEEQSYVVAEIGKNVNNINDATSASSVNSQKLKEMADKLNHMSSSLHTAVSKYII